MTASSESAQRAQNERRRPRLWEEEELDHPWFRVDELLDILHRAELARRRLQHKPD